MKSRSVLITAGIVVAGIVAGLSIVFWPSHSMTGSGHAEGEASRADNGKERGRDEKAKGPHGGRLLESGDFGLEVTIFEKGVPPEFRAYAYEKGKAVGPAGVNLRIALERLGAAPEDIAFRPEGDYLRGASSPNPTPSRWQSRQNTRVRPTGGATNRRKGASPWPMRWPKLPA